MGCDCISNMSYSTIVLKFVSIEETAFKTEKFQVYALSAITLFTTFSTVCGGDDFCMGRIHSASLMKGLPFYCIIIMTMMISSTLRVCRCRSVLLGVCV